MIDETTFNTTGNGAAGNRADEMFKAYRRQLKNRRGRALVYTILGSLLLHTGFVLAVAYIPAVSDALYLTNMFQGAEFADEAYRRTRLNDSSLEVVAVINPNDLFQYPEGYFTPYHGTQMTPGAADSFNDALVVSTAPNFTPEPLFPQPTPVPTPVSPVVKPTPNTEVASATNTNGATNTDNTNNTNAAGNANNTNEEIAADTPEPTEQEAQKARDELGFPKLNPLPFKVLLAEGKKLYDAKLIDLSEDLEMEIEAVREKDGSLRDYKIVRSTGSPEARQLALDFIAALSDSRVLSRLEGMNRLNMRVKLDKTKVSTEIKSEMTSADEAKKLSDGFGVLLAVALFKREGGEEAVQIYKNIKLTAKDKQVVVNFAMPREQAGTLISTQLAKPS